jgi:hypothetical protein
MRMEVAQATLRGSMSEPVFTPAEDLARWRELNREIERFFELGEPALRAASSAVSAWSPLEHLAHLTLANELVLRNLQSFAKRTGMLLQTGAASNPQALALLAEGRLLRGQAKAPRIVVPPRDVELEFVRQWHADNVRALAELAPGAIEASELTIPHQILGPLNAPQWLRFAVVHTRHHLDIAKESADSLGARAQ